MSGIIGTSFNMKSGAIGAFDDDSFFVRKGGLQYQIGNIGWDTPIYKGSNINVSTEKVYVGKAGLYFCNHKFITISNYNIDVYANIYHNTTNLNDYSVHVERDGHGSSRNTIQMTWLWNCSDDDYFYIANSNGYAENPIFVGHRIGD